MKTKTKWLLNLVKGFLDVVWYANMVIIGIAVILLTWIYATNTNIDVSSEVQYRTPPPAVSLTGLPSQIIATVQNDQALVKINVRITAWMIIQSYLLMFVFEALVVILIYNLRKVFGSIKKQQPFEPGNVKRLKITALCFALLTPWHMLTGLLNFFQFSQVPTFYGRFMLVWSDNFIGVIIGAVIYIIADVFSYGFELKKENEEFV